MGGGVAGGVENTGRWFHRDFAHVELSLSTRCRWHWRGRVQDKEPDRLGRETRLHNNDNNMAKLHDDKQCKRHVGHCLWWKINNKTQATEWVRDSEKERKNGNDRL